ncbi:CxxH/CxxC protein (TIGR04129 family) [Pullulanibacillus pueri]|uniref:CxxH/CxxC protein n=1 Tax=Pullulanibacillus pueri TaxID=1437324 RepID=A0A8J2ZV02_9BACL|nr:CxxH/CxxC protein [Pullulanibacillus pueri]MBM7682198.1 CxxH/CxxC protein (TIGR04129 family) [Pullulanibacillus pueri]GGH80414.1 hypothetical protein GCM10007096_16780 [Pullulanibacillus pueri]
MIYSCLEDIELALEAIIDDTQEPPIIEALSEEEQLSTRCEYCQEPAQYLVTNMNSDT